jgi:hypothetical protein
MTSHRFLLNAALGASLFCGSAGCFSNDDDDASSDVAQDPAAFAADFKATPYGVAVCDAHDGKLKGRRELRVYNAGGYNSSSFTRGMANYYARHDLAFFTRFAATKVDMPFALQTDEKVLEARLRKRFPKIDFDAPVFSGTQAQLDEITTAAANFTFEPVLDFIAQNGHQDPSITNVILVPKVTSSSITKDPRAHIAGLSLSPELVRAAREGNDDTAKTWRLIPLPDSFNAMVIIDAPFTTEVPDKKIIDLTMAHEFGHSAGLVHVADTTNLMTPVTDVRSATCLAHLTDEQLTTMATTLHVGPQPQGQALRSTAQKIEHAGLREQGIQERWLTLHSRLAGQNGGGVSLARELLGLE